MSADETRVVLVKPGDVLVFGNVGLVEPERLQAVIDVFKEDLGVRRVVMFAADIDLALIPADAL